MPLRAANLSAIALAAMIGAGFLLDQPRLGLHAGVLVASGIALVVGTERLRRGPLALPPATAIVGAIFIGFGVVSFVRPAAVFIPRWIAHLDRVDRLTPAFPGTRVFADDKYAPLSRADLDAAIVTYQSRLLILLGDAPLDSSEKLKERCAIDILFPSGQDADRLARAVKLSSEFGFFHQPLVGRPVIVVPPASAGEV